VAAGDPAVDAMIAQGEELFRRRGELTPRTFVALFRSGAHSVRETPDELPDWLERGARHAMEERRSWEADIPLDALASAPFPTLVISGDHSPAFEAVCDVLAERVGAERAVIPGRGHSDPRPRPHDPEHRRALQRAAPRVPDGMRGAALDRCGGDECQNGDGQRCGRHRGDGAGGECSTCPDHVLHLGSLVGQL
jgi:pimeloyl-ACP methyl ester carboxylesterase